MVPCFDLSSFIFGPSLPFLHLSTVASLHPLGVYQPSLLLWRSFFIGDSVRDVLSGEGGGVSGSATHRRDTGVAVKRTKAPGEGHVRSGMFSIFCLRASKSALFLSCTGLQRLLAAIRELQTIDITRAHQLPCQSRHSPPGREARGNRASMASLLSGSLFSGLHGFHRNIGAYSPYHLAAPRGLIFVIFFARYSCIMRN